MHPTYTQRVYRVVKAKSITMVVLALVSMPVAESSMARRLASMLDLSRRLKEQEDTVKVVAPTRVRASVTSSKTLALSSSPRWASRAARLLSLVLKQPPQTMKQTLQTSDQKSPGFLLLL